MKIAAWFEEDGQWGHTRTEEDNTFSVLVYSTFSFPVQF